MAEEEILEMAKRDIIEPGYGPWSFPVRNKDRTVLLAQAFAIKDQEAPTVAQALVKGVVALFGVPRSLHSDKNSNCESTVFREMCEILGIDKTRTTTRRPQSDGMVEKSMNTIKEMLSSYVDDRHKNWDQILSVTQWACSLCRQGDKDLFVSARKTVVRRHLIEQHPGVSHRCDSCYKFLGRADQKHGTCDARTPTTLVVRQTCISGSEAKKVLNDFRQTIEEKIVARLLPRKTVVPAPKAKKRPSSEPGWRGLGPTQYWIWPQETLDIPSIPLPPIRVEEPIPQSSAATPRPIQDRAEAAAVIEPARSVVWDHLASQRVTDVKLAAWSDVQAGRVVLDIGGTRFVTSKFTLKMEPSSLLAEMVKKARQ
ncbi:unnamed protein product [Mytilus coruscus]|uniref:Integrase catalytic domain-containing protein n=1 Tax=Mytilus coruscus TaxID=42192 RepID=A0A6J8ET31_MYTCO|nr:unnamed protein product [Mytilus coruscus]